MSGNANELLNKLQSKESEHPLIGAAAQAIFECVQCGFCCRDEGYALVIDQDINRLAEMKGCTFEEALGFYTDIFDPYNVKMETGIYDEHLTMQHSLINHMEGILNTPWLKKIPSEPSMKGFIKYLRKQDAESTLIPIDRRP
jgi:hypothetical protein